MAEFDNIEDYITDLKQKLAQNDGCGNTHYNLGVAYLSKREFMLAETSFLSAISNSPRMAEGYVQLGGICMHRGDLVGCLNYNKEASQIRPFFAVPWGNIGFVQMQQGETEKAMKSLKRALKYDPKFVQALATMGSAYLAAADIEEALKVLNKAVTIQENFGPAWNNLALCYAETAEWAKAKDCIERAEKSGFVVSDELKAEIAENI